MDKTELVLRVLYLGCTLTLAKSRALRLDMRILDNARSAPLGGIDARL